MIAAATKPTMRYGLPLPSEAWGVALVAALLPAWPLDLARVVVGYLWDGPRVTTLSGSGRAGHDRDDNSAEGVEYTRPNAVVYGYGNSSGSAQPPSPWLVVNDAEGMCLCDPYRGWTVALKRCGERPGGPFAAMAIDPATHTLLAATQTQVWRIDASGSVRGGRVSCVAGQAHDAGYRDGDARRVARFHGPHALACSRDGRRVYVADSGNWRVRCIVFPDADGGQPTATSAEPKRSGAKAATAAAATSAKQPRSGSGAAFVPSPADRMNSTVVQTVAGSGGMPPTTLNGHAKPLEVGLGRVRCVALDTSGAAVARRERLWIAPDATTTAVISIQRAAATALPTPVTADAKSSVAHSSANGNDATADTASATAAGTIAALTVQLGAVGPVNDGAALLHCLDWSNGGDSPPVITTHIVVPPPIAGVDPPPPVRAFDVSTLVCSPGNGTLVLACAATHALYWYDPRRAVAVAAQADVPPSSPRANGVVYRGVCVHVAGIRSAAAALGRVLPPGHDGAAVSGGGDEEHDHHHDAGARLGAVAAMSWMPPPTIASLLAGAPTPLALPTAAAVVPPNASSIASPSAVLAVAYARAVAAPVLVCADRTHHRLRCVAIPSELTLQ